MENYKNFEWLNAELLPGEVVLWKGTPSSNYLLTASDIFLIPFSIVWCSFAIFWELTAIIEGPLLFKLFGLPFVFVGLYISFGRFIHQKYLLNRTYYALTDKRAVFYRNGRIASCDYTKQNFVQLKMRKNGLGTISFGESDNRFNNGDWVFGNFKSGLFEFVNINDAQSVHRIIIQQKAYN